MDIFEQDLNRRQLLQAGVGAALAAYGLSACGGSDSGGEAQFVKPEIDGDLLIFNWAEYMDPALKKSFSEKYGVEVNEVNFDNLEGMLIKMRQGGGPYDLIFPSGEYVDRLKREGLLATFDRDSIPNSKGVNPYYDSPWYDEDSNHSMPYTYYTTGICWRNDVVTDMTGSWNDLTNPDGEGRMFILDDFQEAIGEANLLNGFELNTEEPDEIEQSKETLLEQKEFARGFSTNTIQNLASGSAVIQQAWNGDVVNTRNQVDNPEDFSYETCKEGVPVGSDTMAIPNNARAPGTALLFINWILQPDNAAQNVAWHGYPQPVEGGEEEFAKLVKEEPSIDVSLDQLEDKSLEFRFETPEGRQLWAETFTEVKAS
ncbi:MAG: transporter substrate-binding protein [Solirubrobacterales bacterium]|nr:transporter substrate-binding protein [Solirubrobacterales bacterium]